MRPVPGQRNPITLTADAIALVRSSLAAVADPAKAEPMAAYMKTEMPFYGVQKSGRVPIARQLVRRFPAGDRAEYEAVVRGLWGLDHREEKYLALAYARGFPSFVDAESMELYRDLIVEGAWWDLVDEAATKLVGAALADDRPRATPIVRSWISSDDVWLRRTSIIAQLGHKDRTDLDLLAAACIENRSDPEFFIRKAIGWALRQHARTDPDWVRAFLGQWGDELSPLSVREATKHLTEG